MKAQETFYQLREKYPHGIDKATLLAELEGRGFKIPIGEMTIGFYLAGINKVTCPCCRRPI